LTTLRRNGQFHLSQKAVKKQTCISWQR